MRKTTIGSTFYLFPCAVEMREPAGRLAVKVHFGGRYRRLYSEGRHQLQMFSSSNCNFFVPFAQKDARFASAASRGAVSLPSAQKISREIKA
jgi:hypothetical protein